ncbi:MAG: hypothetical protein L6R37_003144 [Teloschistes peruensis]|nr:MAG: hypothetical protein L6R37_003144 [Teloschistes peruensis]
MVTEFVGRNGILQELERHTIRSPQTKRRKVVVLHGLGGIGKTPIAIEHAIQQQDHYTAVFWLNGKSEETLKNALVAAAEQIPLPAVPDAQAKLRTGESSIQAAIAAVMQWLENMDNSKWLLIIDNVDNQASSSNGTDDSKDQYDVTRYFPAGFQGTIILTTRLSRLAQLGSGISVGEVNIVDGIQMLRNFAGQSVSDFGKIRIAQAGPGSCQVLML